MEHRGSCLYCSWRLYLPRAHRAVPAPSSKMPSQGAPRCVSPGPRGGSSSRSNHWAQALSWHICVSPAAKARGGAAKSPLSPERVHVSLPDSQDPQHGSCANPHSSLPPCPFQTALQPPCPCQLLTPQAAWASTGHRVLSSRCPGGQTSGAGLGMGATQSPRSPRGSAGWTARPEPSLPNYIQRPPQLSKAS